MALDGLKGRQHHVQSEQDGAHGCDETTFHPHSNLRWSRWDNLPTTQRLTTTPKSSQTSHLFNILQYKNNKRRWMGQKGGSTMSNRNERVGMVATRQPSNHTATYDDAKIFPNLSFIQYLAIKKQQMALDGLKGGQYHVQSEWEGRHGRNETTFQPHSNLQRCPNLPKPLIYSISCNSKTTHGVGWAKRAAVPCPIGTRGSAWWSQQYNLPTTRQLRMTPKSFQTSHSFNILQWKNNPWRWMG